MQQQQISVVTLGVADLARSRRFYVEGFGWRPAFDNGEIVFYQMNGVVFGTWLTSELEGDMQRPELSQRGAFALAHNVGSEDEVRRVIERLCASGGTLLRAPDAPPHGGFRGYVADPDEHAWEIAWNPAWTIHADGRVTAAF
jgi:uncharacterized protein